MKRILLALSFCWIGLAVFSQTQQFDVSVLNVEVPVRVFDGSLFIDNLTLDDFVLFDDGRAQKLEAVYLVRKSDLARQEQLREFAPIFSRNFYLLFQLTNYNPRLEGMIDYLFMQVLQPGDTLTIMTLVDKYTLSRKAFEMRPRETLAREMKAIVRKDTMLGASSYRNVLRDLRSIIQGISGVNDLEEASSTEMFTMETLFPRYREGLDTIEQMRRVDERSFINFARMLRMQKGQNLVYFFYEREFRPEINQATLSRLMSIFQDEDAIMGYLQELFLLYSRQPQFDPRNILLAFADSNLVFNFIFLNVDPEVAAQVNMREQSEDIYSAFSEVARSTGGVVEASQNPEDAFKKAMEKTDAYYLLYYTPQNYIRDGKFRQIKVAVRGKEYSVIHRSGYFANR